MIASKKKAFTLIELLVVISIIALLVGILLPALGAARRTAQAVVCQSNMKNVSTAFVAYGADNNAWWPCWATGGESGLGNHGWIPSGFIFNQDGTEPYPTDLADGTIWQYTPDYNVFACPSDPYTPYSSGLSYTTSNHIYRLPTGSGSSAQDWPTLPNGGTPTVRFPARYADPAVQVSLRNSSGGIIGRARYPNSDKFAEPSNLIFLVDEGAPAVDANLPGSQTQVGVIDGYFLDLFSPDGNNSAGSADKTKWYHSDGAAFGFADGHGEVRKKTDPEIYSYERALVGPSNNRDFFYGRIWDPAAQAPRIRGES